MYLAIKNFLKLKYFKLKYCRKKVVFTITCHIGIKSRFEGLNRIGKKSSFCGLMGYGTYIGSFCNISGKIGRYCSIASNVNVLTATHPLDKFVSTNPVFYSLLKQNGATYVKEQCFEEYLYADKVNKYPVVIGNDVWIGYGATLIGGINIGDGAVVLANATVTEDVLPYTIVAGVPAKPLKKRFDEETVAFLLDFQWWNKPEEWIRQHASLFKDVEEFKNSQIK